MHYVDEGSGPPVLLVHGNPTWSFMYREVIRAFRGSFRVLAPDHLGMGLSERTPDEGRRNLAARVSDLGSFLDGIGLEDPVRILAHDWGGPVALGWALRHPARVASVSLMNTGLRIPRGYRMPARLALFQRVPAIGALLARDLGLFARGLADAGTVRPLSARAREGLLAPYARREHRAAIAGFVRDIPWRPSHPSGRHLEETDALLETALAGKPVSLIWGLRDFVFTPLFLYDLKKRLPRARVLALPRSGHYLLEDEPGRIIRFLGRFWNALR
jgi:haloalkane dehalogenase